MSNSKWCLPAPCYEPTPLPKSQSSPYCKTCDFVKSPYSTVQSTQVIDNQVRMDASAQTSRLGPQEIRLGARQLPWSNFSDRARPSVQHAAVSRGLGVTAGRPGGMTPGGKGVDVKHGSYARYLNKLKGGRGGCVGCPAR